MANFSRSCAPQGRSRMVRALCLVTALFCVFCGAQSAPPDTRRAQPLFQMIGKDPLGEQDSFKSLAPSELRNWGHNSGKGVHQMIQDFKDMEMKVRVDIRLVGFDGEGSEGLFIPSSQVVFHLRSLKPDLKGLALQRLTAELWREIDLGVNTKVMYQVTKVKTTLCSDIASKISEAVDRERSASHTPGNEAVQISYEVVDEILAADYSRTGGIPTIYILNPKMPAAKYMYYYKSREACTGTLWTSTNQRYFWIDLTAGPVNYGPSESGEGRVLSHSIPRVEHYNEAWRSKAMVPDIAALVFSGTKHLITPASMNLYQKDWLKMEIQVIHIHDTMNPSKAIQEISEYEDIIKELQQVVLPGQSVHMEHYYVGFGHCSACVAAYSRAMRSKTERMPGAGMHITSSNYLDSHILYDWLSDEYFQEDLTDNQGRPIKLKADKPMRILPVFIFEISSFEALVLDGQSASESFPDMVLAVRTHGGGATSSFTCMLKRPPIDTTKIRRPLLASILTSGWGVLNTAQSVSAGNQEVQLDYTWSVGNTVYGFLANTPNLSFSQRDTARRNTVLAKIHGLIIQTDAVLRGFANISSTGYIHDAFSSKKDATRFLQRLDMLQFKMKTSVSRLGTREYDEAWYFARSAKHDITDLYSLAQTAAELSVSVVQCPGQKGRLRFWLLGSIGVGMGVFFGILRKLRRKKKRHY